MALRLPTDREGLVLHDGLEPREQLGRVGRRRLRQQDLDAALVRVLGVLRRGRVAPRSRHQLRAVALQQLDRGRVDLAARGADSIPAVWSKRCRHWLVTFLSSPGLASAVTSGTGVDITATEGASLTKRVANIDDCVFDHATINWGDGTPTSAGARSEEHTSELQ